MSTGAAAGAVTGILTTPFDVLKTRLMTQGSSGTYKHVGDCAVKIWREEGWKTFFKVGCRVLHLGMVIAWATASAAFASCSAVHWPRYR